MQPRKDHTAERSPLRLLLWTAVAGLIFGLIGFGELPEDLLRSSRNSLHPSKASGDIVLVSIDDKSLRTVGRWPWPRRYHAQLTDALTEAGAKRIFFDVMFENGSDPGEDRLFAEAIAKSARVTLPVRTRTGFAQGSTPQSTPLPILARNAEIGSISLRYNYHNSAWTLPFAARVGDQAIQSYAAKLASVDGRAGQEFPLDYSIDPKSIPTVTAVSVLDGKVDRARLAGKDIVIGVTSDASGDQYFMPGWGQMGGVYTHLIGAETLKAGVPLSLGWIPALMCALALGGLAAWRKSAATRNLILGGGLATMLFGPTVLEMHLVFADITPGLFVLIVISSVLTWRGFRRRGLVNSVSGLPNLTALRFNREGRHQALIAARVLNYAEIVASLPADGERQLVEQIVARLGLGAPDRVLFQGDGGIFAWFEGTRLPFGNHFDALHALFRNPARVGGRSIDVSVAFGVEIGSSRSLDNRLASALVAADEAAHDGLKWKYHDPESLRDASWKLSMMSQLDSAIDTGEVWVAYQPKLDLATNEIVGAEALARWTHPDRGPIAACEFVAAAEQHNRIAKLTDFVLDTAIAAGAELNWQREGFTVAVNLSARLLSDQGLLLRLTAMLARHSFPATQLTLELTETAELGSNGAGIGMLSSLEELGITISIDDYGTGLSTLEYLKKIPAREIKIDQSFVKGLIDNRSDRVMVQSTIALAHSLGRRVVAEGVEQRDTLEALVAMKCDLAQGFVIGRPMSLENLFKRIPSRRKSKVA